MSNMGLGSSLKISLQGENRICLVVNRKKLLKFEIKEIS